MKRTAHVLLLAALGLACGARSATAQAAEPAARPASAPAPVSVVSPADTVCAAGRISAIDVETLPIGPPEGSDEGALGWGFRVINHLHVRTTHGFIRGQLLLEEGDCYDPVRATDSQLTLERYSFIADASVVAEDDSAGGKRLRVRTRDQWSTKGDLGVTYDEGLNLEVFRFTEQNFLGRGMFVELTQRQRLEQKSRALGLSVPDLFPRTTGALNLSTSPDGRALSEFLGRGFSGESGRFSARESFSDHPTLFAWATDGAEPFSHVLMASRARQIEVAAAARFGPPGALVVVGASATRDWLDPEPATVVFGDFDRRSAPTVPLPTALARQARGWSATRLALHLGFRRYRYATYEGLDAVRDRQLVGLGFFAGASLGHTLPFLEPDHVSALEDLYARVHASWGLAAGPLLLHGGTTSEGRREDGRWKDLLGGLETVAYLRGLPGQILFARASLSGGWRTELPYQLTLGGREGVRALGPDRFPGGRQALFVLEDRIRFPRMPQNALDLGATVFADLGRVWPGDVPFGTDSGWQADAGFGLRIAFPSGTRNIWRPDVVFPVGPGAKGSPFFRVTFELNRFRAGFFNPDDFRSHRFQRGADSF